ncbi:MAG: ankyrin repeat domain-containing protein [Gammaproteobacteria bacterium]|nr:ankyrin repeat domain-containing protein [Gammaproteobacteria bacterium]
MHKEFSNEQQAEQAQFKKILESLNASFDSKSNFHQKLINFAKGLGYPVKDDGICNGFTWRWIEAILTNQTSLFLERIQIILEFPKASGIDQLEPLTKLDIKAFLESLLLFQYAELSANILKKPLSQENRKEISTIASSQAMEEAGGFKVSQPIYYGNFDKVDFRYLLTELQEKIKKTDYIDPIPFLLTCISQSGAFHAISIVYKPGGLWQFMDINRFPNIPELEIDALIENLEQESFNNFHAFTIQAVLPMEEKKGFAWDDMSFGKQITDQLTTQNMKKLLYLAASKGHLEVVKALLDGGVDPNQAATNGITPLLIAASIGHLEVVQALLAGGVDRNQAATNGITPLLIAASIGHLEVVQALLDGGGDPNQAATNGATPLFLAASIGHLEVVKALLAGGVDRNQAATNGATPLLTAAQNGHLEVVQALLAGGVDPNQAATDGITPLLTAAQNGHLEVVKALLAGGGDPNQAATNGATPLLTAALNGHLEVVKALLAGGVDPNQAATDGITPLFLAASKGHLEVVKALLAGGVDPNQAATDGITPLLTAAQNGHLEVVKALLAGGVDPNQAATNGDTPLFLAASKGHIEVVKALLAGGVDPNPVVTDGITPLLTAAQNGHLKVVLALLARKTDLDNPRTNDAATPYLCVAQNGYHMVIKALLARKAAANNPDSDLIIMQLLTHYLRLPPGSSSAKPILDAIARLANDKSSNFEESIGCIYTLHLQHRFIAAFIIKRFIQFCLVLPFIYVVWKGQLTKTNTECAIAEFKEKYPLNPNLAARNESAPSLF